MDSKIKCVIVDDELLGLKYLKMLCEQLQEIHIVGVFNNGLTFLEKQAELDYQVVILDINMPGINGLQIAELLSGKAVIFCTAYKEYAVQAFEVDAVDYLTKPIKKERLSRAIAKVKARIQTTVSHPYLWINTNKGKAMIYFDSIALISTCEIDARDKVVYTLDNKEILIKNTSLDKLIDTLPQKDFVRINKREIIALRAVSYFSLDLITTRLLDQNNKPRQVSIGAVYKNDFLAIM